jgi:hypothetical protein
MPDAYYYASATWLACPGMLPSWHLISLRQMMHSAGTLSDWHAWQDFATVTHNMADGTKQCRSQVHDNAIHLQWQHMNS